ncbi:hypothetical protein [Chryseobacterium sp. SL1]|uniref:hypothetical protein n=1 Tax=Chryseobacterium sp. SL1 TaxID=2995159 RepID=UPI0022745218|nr:hypothetical protein [Chryseobacterium sp. SL1]MCY1662746.1 hypothetical protein [Chryseobacterium sp. SL1]
MSDSEKNNFLNRFDYYRYQPSIAFFFMKYAIELDIKTCYYCNLEFVNTFSDIGEYNNILDFLNNGTKEELTKYIGNTKGTIIFEYLESNTITSVQELQSIYNIGKETINKINSLNISTGHLKNHFTLDHFIPKGDLQYFGLSLYNLVPSCYSCNSKFKKSKQYDLDETLNFISPTSNSFSLADQLTFKLYFNVSGIDLNEKVNNINNLHDFIIRPEFEIGINNNTKKFLDIFKIRGRYKFHKYQSMKMIKKRQEYSDSSIDEISKITKKSIAEIKKDLFGTMIYSIAETNEPLAKYKRDIAKQIGIFP